MPPKVGELTDSPDRIEKKIFRLADTTNETRYNYERK